MLSLFGTLLKLAAFAAIVLVAGSWLKWDGKTISDQVKTHLAHAERTETVRKVKSLVGDQGHRKPAATTLNSESDDIPSTERQKLRALINELNRSR